MLVTTFDTFLRAAARADAVEPGPAVGTILDGNYELVERIARGGMATVYRAHDRALGREVAIKIPNLRHGDSAPVFEMFEREARITARLCHPSIVVLHHIGRHHDRPYLVLELLHGETLAQRLARRGALTSAEAVAILDAILQALAYIHERGLIHRDLTPRNVFLGHDERVTLLDFGVAVEHERAAGTVTRGAGTRGYMAPEHASAPDPRGDLWAAGVLFLECVTGQRPDLEHALVVPEGVPPRIAHVVRAALADEPERRPTTASEMRHALRRDVELAPAQGGGWIDVALAAVLPIVLAVVAVLAR